ncbi:MAG: hypothetical protein WD824_10760 [Cyclobacteriaceae bacterium]
MKDLRSSENHLTAILSPVKQTFNKMDRVANAKTRGNFLKTIIRNLNGLLLLMLLSISCLSQPEQGSYQKSFYLELGWGAGRGLASNFQINKEFEKSYLISFGASGNARGWTTSFFSSVREISARSTFLGVGKIKKNEWGFWTFSFGPSLVRIARSKVAGFEIETNVERTLGIQAETSVRVASRSAGLSFKPFININPEYLFGGFTINVALGKLHYKTRDKKKTDRLGK